MTTLPARLDNITVPSDLLEHDELLAKLLVARGISEKDDVQAFLSPNYETGLFDPFQLHSMWSAVLRVERAMKDNEKIAVFSDYDADGIPGAVVLHDLFKALHYENIVTYIPHRHYEGFGLSTQAVKKLADAQVTLIITVDCGTTDSEAVDFARTLGVDVIVTDHHEVPTILPNAVAVVNPKLGNYPFPHLCGAAVAFKFAQALLKVLNHSLAPGMEKWWLDMVGVATIADMVPLVGENRIFAHYGLMVLRKTRRPGVAQLLKKAKIVPHYLSEDDIGFVLAPRINAASRMDAPERAFSLLTESDNVIVSSIARDLEDLNNERKGMVSVMTREINEYLLTIQDVPSVIVYGNPQWRPSLAGLVATKIADEYRRPVFIWGRDGNNVLKGSCRSGGGVSVVSLMSNAHHLFREFGGHHASGGFSLAEGKVFSFSDSLNDVYSSMKVDLTEEVDATVPDIYATFSDINRLHHLFSKLAPFGTGNPRPIVGFSQVTPTKVEQFGKTKEHLKLLFRTEFKDIEAISFFSSGTDFTTSPQEGCPCTLYTYLEQSFFMNRQQLRLRIVDIV
jgi:single-stranded-DNA-specific exonuclease